jgi:hypothetical protein
MEQAEFETLLKNDGYQVFLFTCRATMPFFFAQHSWFVVNQKGKLSRWEIFWQAEKPGKTSWGHLHKDCWPPAQGIEIFFGSDRYCWGSKLVGIVGAGDGSLAERMAAFIGRSPETYRHCRQYRLRGPNSNTYAQWVLDAFPDSGLRLPWNAFGKDFKRGL